KAADAQFLDRRQELEWKSVLHPILGDHGRDPGFHERADSLDDRELLGRQGLAQFVEVRIRRRQWFRVLSAFCCGWHFRVLILGRVESVFSCLSHAESASAMPSGGLGQKAKVNWHCC